MRRRVVLALGALVLAPVLALLGLAVQTPLPPGLSTDLPAPSLRVLDRHGSLIREVRDAEGGHSGALRLPDAGPDVIAALLAAEDARFFAHPGVDPLAVVRAAAQAVWHRRIVSGASTLTQQLARTVVPRTRDLSGKIREMALALRIDATLTKERILEEYLSRVAFGPNVRGIEAASHLYFDKPPSRLSLAEAAALVGIPRGPTLYDPARGTQALLARRNTILERLRDGDVRDDETIDRALREPLTLKPRFVEGGALHLVRALATGRLEPWTAQGGRPREIVSTLDLPLQREVETLAAATAERLRGVRASAVAALVVDNATSEVLADVGSPGFFSGAGGQNDGARALRQPGSALKPFVYAAAMQELGLTPASVLPDVELHLPTANGTYSPDNYDRHFHGPVRLRVALGSSLNVPAVHTLGRLGAPRVLDVLHRFGFESLSKDATHYGSALALGDGEVRLTELAAAYAALARGGTFTPLRFARTITLATGERVDAAPAASRRVLDPRIAALVTDVLADPAARVASFGRASALELPFPAAVKTGTSKGFRDNLAVGYTREVTVAVWVGNFDGTPMVGSSGVTGAAPLLRDVLIAAERGRELAPLVSSASLAEGEICALSGARPGPDCPHRIVEHFVPGTEPRGTCATHVRMHVDAEGRRAGAECGEGRAFEQHVAPFLEWARQVGRPLPPDVFSTVCPPRPSAVEAAVRAPRVVYPEDGARFLFDPSLPGEQQAIVLRARAEGSGAARFLVDGKELGARGDGVTWALQRGEHVVRVAMGGAVSDAVRFVVQ